ncbi:MAG TPA: hypothetical protein VFD92_27955 [Candidatus Binatia bacterium]|nr:hypothetical protein [Candidatus Binatia bacterium]
MAKKRNGEAARPTAKEINEMRENLLRLTAISQSAKRKQAGAREQAHR